MKSDELADELDIAFNTIRKTVDHFGIPMTLSVGPLENGQMILIEFPVKTETMN